MLIKELDKELRLVKYYNDSLARSKCFVWKIFTVSTKEKN